MKMKKDVNSLLIEDKKHKIGENNLVNQNRNAYDWYDNISPNKKNLTIEMTILSQSMTSHATANFNNNSIFTNQMSKA